MIFKVVAMLAFRLTIACMAGAESATCPSGIVAVNITSRTDVHNLTGALACVGEGEFNITWYSSLIIDERIEVSGEKNVTVTGAGVPSFRGALSNDKAAGVIIDAGGGTGIFSVSGGSTLRLNNLVLEGGNTENGGAVAVVSSSALFVFGCTFINSNASNGGGVGPLKSAKEGRPCCVYITKRKCSAAIFLVVSKLLFGIYTLLWPRRTPRTVEPLAQVGAPTGARRLCRKFELKEYQQPEQLPCFKVLFGYQGDGESVLGAIFASNSTIDVNGSTSFYNNSAVLGGVIYANSSEIAIDGITMFTNNSAAADGGVIRARSSKVRIVGDAMFMDNSAGAYGGVVHANLSEIGIAGNASFTNNAARFDAGAVYATLSNICFEGSTEFFANSAGYWGGAVYIAKSVIGMEGNAVFAKNSARGDAGALFVHGSNVTVAGSKIRRGRLSGNEGGLGLGRYSDKGGDYTSELSVVFVNNSAGGKGGAMFIEECDQVQVSYVKFKYNEASLGGALYVLAVDDKQTFFSECVLEANTAADGGAVYFYTGPGVDIFNASVFRNNFSWTSGGAIFHTGSMRVSNTRFVANKARVEGPAVMSVGFLQEMDNVDFLGNVYYCPAGKYGYIDKNETSFCHSCFEEVCSRCSTTGDGVSIRKGVRIDGLPVCAEPPLGSTASSSGTTVANLALEKGYFRTSNESHVILQCYRESACQGGKDAGKYCAPGYTGPYCAVCASGFAPGIAYSCRQCSGGITRSAVGLSVAAGLAMLLSAGLLLSYMGSGVHDGVEEGIEIDQRLWRRKFRSCRVSLANILPLRAIKIVVTVWQIISQFDAIAGDVYPELYQAFVSKLNPINLDLDFVFSYSCLVSNDFYDHLLFATITPLIVLVVLAGSYFIGKRRNSCSEFAMREVRHKHQAAVFFIAFLVYSPVSYKIFQTFGCDELDDGEVYLRADYSLSCLTVRHSWYKVYAFIMVGVYAIGITAAFAGLVLWHRRDLVKPGRETMLHLTPFKSVWAAYKPSRYYYEVVECGRRIALTVIAAFVLPNTTVQMSIALLFALMYVFISEVLSPFQKGIDTGLYRWGNGIVVASMYVAFLMKIDVDQDTASAEYLLTFSGVLITANVFMFFTVLVQTVLLAKHVRAMKHAVKVNVRPVRRTYSASTGGVNVLNERGLCWERGAGLEPISEL